MGDFTPALTGHGVDRDDHTRADPARLARMKLRDDAQLMRLDGLMPLIENGALTYAPFAETPQDVETVYLGLKDGTPTFVPVPGVGDARQALEQRANRAVIMQLGPRDLAIYAGARSIVDWHARHRFCANCGQSTALAKGGWQRDCSKDVGGCGAMHFPRTDPVAIMLVEHDGELLLGRGHGWPERSYSALAGFLEPGESLEEGVSREVFEEAGVTVGNVSYVASQPWPFPSQLMIGAWSRADAPDIVLDTTELADARWFTAEEIRAAMNGDSDAPINTPPKQAIANHLLSWWLEKDS